MPVALEANCPQGTVGPCERDTSPIRAREHPEESGEKLRNSREGVEKDQGSDRGGNYGVAVVLLPGAAGHHDNCAHYIQTGFGSAVSRPFLAFLSASCTLLSEGLSFRALATFFSLDR
jgi:hypothetical protein